jgi:ribose transport system ATP-binding protein
MAEPGIAIVGVKKSFGSTQALRGVNFHAKMGEIHAIVGGNGCGKSTLAKVISGVVPVDSGQVSVMGLSPAAPHEARAAGIATVFQEVLVADECSVLENLYMGSDSLWSRTLGKQEKYDTAKTLMRSLAGMPIDPDMLVGLLPLNIKQWITIGRALLCKPRVLILDESSAALDLDSTERLFGKMRELRDSGCAVIIVTHRIAELIRICDRATVLRDGQDVGILEKSEITEKNLLRLMTGKNPVAEEKSHSQGAAQLGAVVLRSRKMKVWPDSRPTNCSLRQGEILGVAGLDGQGQSEFVRMLAGVDPSISTAPLVRNKRGDFVEIEGLKSAVDHGVCYVSGDRKREGIFANLSIYENLLMPLYRRKTRGGWLGIIGWDGLVGTFDWEVERLAIRMGERTNKITSLSGGNQQKVLIGRAFALNPDILILNDPARGIDVGAKAELYKHLRDFAATGKSVIYLSSEIEEFVGFCARVVVFRNGSVFDEFKGSEIHPTAILESMFGQTRTNQSHPTDDDEASEDHAMKIVEFDDHAKPQGQGDASSWKSRTSPYPSFDKKKDAADSGERASSATPFEALTRPARSQRSADEMPVTSPASASRVGPIKILEFNTGPASSLAKATAHGGQASNIKALDTRTIKPESDGDKAGVKAPIKIVEFGNDQASAAPSAASVNHTGIKIVEYGDHKGKGK